MGTTGTNIHKVQSSSDIKTDFDKDCNLDQTTENLHKNAISHP